MKLWVRLAMPAIIACVAGHAAAQTDDAVIDQARAAVVRYKLAERPDCVSYEVTRDVHPMVDEVTVREIHNKRCGGDPSVAPQVATLRIDQRHKLVARYDALEDKFRLLK